MKAIRSCFVIGPIGDENTSTRERADFLFRGIIEPALHTSPLQYDVLRADMDQKPGLITDAVITRIVESDLAIADLTELNPNVFYELGIRHTVRKPVIHMAELGTKLPFDNAGYRAIIYKPGSWASIEAARAELARHAAETLKESYSVTNPVTQALTLREFETSADPKEQVIATMERRIDLLEGTITKLNPIAASIAPVISMRRKKMLDTVARTERFLGIRFDQTQVKNFIERFSNSETLYSDFWAVAESQDFNAIKSWIEDEIPF